MRYQFNIFVLALFILGFQSKLFADIAGSPHDFSRVDSNHRGSGEICKICHTPHNSNSTDVPLWWGNLSPRVYSLYSSDTLDATVNQPLAPTKICLTCHDGSIASSQPIGCLSCHKAVVGGGDPNLGNDHPVSFIYDTTLAQTDGTLRDPRGTAVASLGGKTIQEGMLYQDRLECSSCHDVHAKKGDSGLQNSKLLLVNNTGSALCLTCHNK